MSDQVSLSRRQLLRNSLSLGGIVAGVASAKAMASGILTDACSKTPPQAEGPFYPIKDQADKDNDLTVVKGKTVPAKGTIVYIYGTVVDDKCTPVANALVEIWQACASGKYNHPGDPNPAKLDPNFQYWGKATTDANGKYDFKTIIPGHYPASNTWERPPHIHYKVHALGFHELTTQLYFAGDPLNDKDLILQGLKASERELVIMETTDAGPGFEPGAKKGTFDLSIRRVTR